MTTAQWILQMAKRISDRRRAELARAAALEAKAVREQRKRLERLGVPAEILDRTRRTTRRDLKGITPAASQSLPRTPDLVPTSDDVAHAGGYKTNIRTDHLWKRGRSERTTTLREIENKASRLRPLFNKGPVQYATQDFDSTVDGKRR